MTAKILQDLMNDEDADIEDFGEIVSDSDWVSEGKYQLRAVVIHVKDNDDGVTPGYYEVSTHRSGSYYSDYEYGESLVTEVERIEVVETVVKYKTK